MTRFYSFCAAVFALVFGSIAFPAPAAAVPLPVALPSVAFGIGAYIPTSRNSNIEGVSPPSGTAITQSGGVALELEVQPGTAFGGYQISAAYLGSFQHVSTPGVVPVSSGGLTYTPGTEIVSQIPIMIEHTSSIFGLVRFGGGLGYDFIHVGGTNAGGVTPPSRSGLVGDAILQVGAGAGTSLEAKLYLNTRAAAGGVSLGLVTKI